MKKLYVYNKYITYTKYRFNICDLKSLKETLLDTGPGPVLGVW